MFEKYTSVNGIRVKLNPYSESRFNKIRVINEDISAWINDNQDKGISDIPSEMKEKWWRAKADVLWTPDKPFPEGFFADEEFEVGILKESEESFIVKRLYI
jgi:hypothetical protein